MTLSGMLSSVSRVRFYVSEERILSIIRVTKIERLRTKLAGSSN
jgi:hypothetical protein